MVDGRKVVGIIAEYNPFHQGHRYMLQQVRRDFAAAYIVVVMSGDFVQRGEPAIFDKYERAAAALRNGADLVLQLPVMFSTSSAEDFAAGGVAVLRSLGFVDELVFGSESGDLSRLRELAELELSERSDSHAQFHAAIRDFTSRGMSYPKAREEAMRLVLPGTDAAGLATLLSEAASPAASFSLKSNDILGLEYLKAVQRQGDCFSVSCIRRDLGLSSAHAIRREIGEEMQRSSMAVRSTADERKDMPERTDASDRCRAVHWPEGMCMEMPSGIADPDMLSDMLNYRLLQLVYLEEEPGMGLLLNEYLDVSREIADAIRRGVREKWSFRERIREIKTRNYTYSRLSRALLHILLGIRRKEHAALRGQYFDETARMPYVRVLGVRADAKQLLSECAVTPVTSPADYKKKLRRQSIGTEYAAGMFRTDLYAADLYRQIRKTLDRKQTDVSELKRFLLVV